MASVPRRAPSACSAARCWARRWRPPSARSIRHAFVIPCTPIFCVPAIRAFRSFTKWTRARDGKSFTARRVVAVQHGKQIFNLAASFQIPESGFDHQFEMPKVPRAGGIGGCGYRAGAGARMNFRSICANGSCGRARSRRAR